MNAEDFFEKIDYSLLREQKKQLYVAMENSKSNDANECLEGILNLIESLQDFVVDELRYAEIMVFGGDGENIGKKNTLQHNVGILK